jgi:PIN domain nuclease of toxin-antitoxin system
LFDRVLIAQSQARVERLTLVAQDASMKAKEVEVLW